MAKLQTGQPYYAERNSIHIIQSSGRGGQGAGCHQG